METLAFLHIYKNGGTTLVDRYKHNTGFVYQRIPSEVVYDYRGQQHKVFPYEVLDTERVKIIAGHGVNFDLHRQMPLNRIKYITVLRDPIQRLMSAFNYYKLELATILDIYTRIDFNTWFFNKSRMLPTPMFWQYQHFSKNCDLYIDFGQNIDRKLERELYKKSIDNIDRCEWVLFLDDNYIEKFDKIANYYGCTPNREVLHHHNTKHQLQLVNLDYTYYEDLSDKSKGFIDKYIGTEIEFYEYCKGKFK